MGGLNKNRDGDGEETEGRHGHEIPGVNGYPRQGLWTGRLGGGAQQLNVVIHKPLNTCR